MLDVATMNDRLTRIQRKLNNGLLSPENVNEMTG